MSKRNFNFAIVITIIWLVGIFTFYLMDLLDRPTTFNELGDFLAGIFSPVAFFWLIYGYLQQGKNLEQNTIALNLQIAEMKENITQQKNIFLLLSKEREEAKARIKPQLELCDSSFCQLIEDTKFQFNIKILNIGVGEALDVILICESEKQMISKLAVDMQELIQIEVPIKEKFSWDFTTLEYSLELEYRDILDNSFYLEKLIIIENNAHQIRNFKLKFR